MRKTPIERLISGEAQDRRVRYEANARRAGLVRIGCWVPAQAAERLRHFAGELRHATAGQLPEMLDVFDHPNHIHPRRPGDLDLLTIATADTPVR